MKKCGFTLMEILVSVMIVGILAAIAVPNYTIYVEKNRAQSAENILMAISAAQQKFYEDYSTYCANNAISPCYCVNSGTNPANPVGPAGSCGDNPSDLSVNLRLVGMSQSDPFYPNYSCAIPAVGDPAGTLYRCTTNDATDNLLLLGGSTGATVTCTGGNCPP